MKVKVDSDEWYPWYTIRSGQHGVEIEATEEQVARWTRVEAEFKAAQKEMQDIFDKLRGITRPEDDNDDVGE